MADAMEFADLQGQTLTKPPGSINGESFVLKNLDACSVYLLDYTSEVEVTNCTVCNIFVGPVDGPAIFDGCSGCQVAVASQQFQVKNCTDMDFGLYVATRPSIAASSDIRISPWTGAYPKLTSHFAAANLDPRANNWDKVYDADADEAGPVNFALVEAKDYWEVPLEGETPPENPVPHPSGAAYVPGGAEAAVEAPANGVPAELSADDFAAPEPMANGTTYESPATLFSEPAEEPPNVKAMKEHLAQRVADQEKYESSGKTELIEKANTYLESFYNKRISTKEQRIKENREAAKLLEAGGMTGDTEWEKAISLIDFNFSRPSGVDLSRMRSVLFTAKAKNVPISTRAEPSKGGLLKSILS